MVKLGDTPVVPPKSNRKDPWDYDKELYKQRNQVERWEKRRNTGKKAVQKMNVICQVDRWKKRMMPQGSGQVERLFRRIKRFRRIFTRYDKLDVIFLTFVYFALIVDALM